MSTGTAMNNVIYGQRVTEARKALGLSQRALAQKIGRSQGFISDIENGRIDPSFDFLVKLKAACGVDPNWIISGTGEMLSTSQHPDPKLSQFSAPDYSRPLHGDFSENGVEYALVKRYDVAVSAGAGRYSLSEAVSESIAFSTRSLREAGITADLSGLVRVEGDSMVPTIRNGSLVLVDFTPLSRSVRSGHIYVYSIGDDVFIKRLANITEDGKPGLLISSDNPNYEPITLFGSAAEEVRIVGRVCGAFTKF